MPYPKRIQPTKQCRVCPRIFTKPVHTSDKVWETRFTCSKECGATHKNLDGDYRPMAKKCENPECRKMYAKALKDTYKHFQRQRYCSISCGKKGKTGDKNNSWVGDKIGYEGVHTWMDRTYGKPEFCEVCKTTAKRMYHWANISDEYKRDRADWMRMCVPHHREFDYAKKKAKEQQNAQTSN